MTRGKGLLLAALAIFSLLLAACQADVRQTGRSTTQSPQIQDAPRSADLVQWRKRSPKPLADRAGAVGKPDVVMVVADDMRADDLRFMPRLNQLVRRNGTAFANSFASFPLCCPARASYLTGQYPHNTGVLSSASPYGFGSFDDSRTLATSLNEVGYQTGMVGKYLNGYGTQPSKVSGEPSQTWVPPGWDEWAGLLDNPNDGSLQGGTYQYFRPAFNVNGLVDDRYQRTYSTKVTTWFAQSMIRKFSVRQDPFFLYLNYIAPHHGSPSQSKRYPITAPATPKWQWGAFDKAISRAPGLFRDGTSEKDVSDKTRSVQKLPQVSRSDAANLRYLTRKRAESLEILDRQIAQLVTTLKSNGAWQNTVLMFTSDNGFYLGEHRIQRGKTRPHEPSLRVPFLAVGPGIPRRVAYTPITSVDIPATILDLADATPPAEPDGVSRLGVLRGGADRWTAAVPTESWQSVDRGDSPWFAGDELTSFGVRTPRYSMTRYADGTEELYDLRRDPLQQESVDADPRYATAQKQLGEVWEKLRKCRGKQCQVELPASLQADRAQLRDANTAYWNRLRKVFELDLFWVASN